MYSLSLESVLLEVFLTGSFVAWSALIEMHRGSASVFRLQLELPMGHIFIPFRFMNSQSDQEIFGLWQKKGMIAGHHQFRFVIDGTPCLRIGLPIEVFTLFSQSSRVLR